MTKKLQQVNKHKTKHDTFTLRNVFDPGWCGHLINHYMSEEELDKIKISRGDFERKAYAETTNEIINDMKKLDIPITYATKILISQLAFDIIVFSKVKFYLMSREPMQEEKVWKLDSVKKNEYSYGKKNYTYKPLDTKEIMHPLFNNFLFKLQKQINKQLELLGLLPSQVLERYKITIIKKMKQKLMEIETKDSKLEVDMVKESKH